MGTAPVRPPAAPRPSSPRTVVGPLPIARHELYGQRYMEPVFPANMGTPVHVHSGAEAWYVVSGAQCSETPDGFKVSARLLLTLTGRPQGCNCLPYAGASSGNRISTLSGSAGASSW